MSQSNDLKQELSKLDKEIACVKWGSAAIIIILLAFYFIWFGYHLKHPLSESPATWGTLGDFFGGLLNPIIAFLALYWLTKSVRIQREELHETRSALQESADSQQMQVRLAALTALTNAIMTEVDIQRNQLMFLVNQLSSLQHSSIRNLEGKSLTFDDATVLIENINSRISQRMLEQQSYEEEIRKLAAKTSVQKDD